MGGPTAIDSILRMPEARAVQMDIDVSGGYLIPPMQFVDTLIQAIDDKVFIRQRATVHQVVGSHSMGMPSLDADPANPVWTSELGTGDEDSSMAFGRRELVPKPLAKMIKISKKAIRARASIEALVKERLAYKFGITEENAFLNGSGVNQPLGLFTPSNDGIPTSRDVATGSSTNITGDALIDARYGVKDGYGEKGEWVLGRTGLKLVRKLKSSDNQYLWQPGLHGGNPSTILDRPYHLSEFSPDTWTTGLYVGLFGDLSYYHIADSLEMTFERLVELFALTNQNAYIGRLEADGMPVLAEAFVRLKTN
jgi:HK97 family phage major capsid protein